MHELSIQQAVELLHEGRVIAYPTETVFGLGCDPDQISAILKLLDLKKRPAEKGLILLASQFDFFLPYIDISQLSQIEINKINQKQQEPTTWLVPKSQTLSAFISGTFENVAIRISEHPIVKQLSDALEKPIISTSANRSGLPTSSTIAEIEQQFGENFPVVKGEICQNCQPSHIIDLKNNLKIR